MAKKNEKNETQELATIQVSQTMPDFLKGKTTERGSEAVSQQDLTIPRIEVVQSLSKARKRGAPEFIEGAEEGMLYNSVTRELYGDSVTIVPVCFLKEYLLWRDQKKGGGFAGAFATEEAAMEALAACEAPEEWESVLTHQHFCLVLKDDGTIEDAVISMAKSKLKVSRKFNSLVRLNGGDRFSRVYRVTGLAAENGQGQEYYSLGIKSMGYVSEAVYRRAERAYEAVMSGAVTADRGAEDVGEPSGGSDEY